MITADRGTRIVLLLSILLAPIARPFRCFGAINLWYLHRNRKRCHSSGVFDVAGEEVLTQREHKPEIRGDILESIQSYKPRGAFYSEHFVAQLRAHHTDSAG
ncbi:MAG TPA: hypothetical protein VGV87_27775 [Blastocatellia bacterium]|jgi:hypothetical protein|nr:hypothetical protein [Blastocatellia bacterium]